MKNYVFFTLFILFWLVVGGMVGYTLGEIDTIKDIDPEACVSVCATEFAKYGC